MELFVFSGRLGSDPEMRFTGDGTPVTTFSVAIDRSYKKDGEKVERTLWVRVTAWRKLAEVCNEYLSKGREVIIQGRVEEPRCYENKSGEWVAANLDVTANSVEFIGARVERDDEPVL